MIYYALTTYHVLCCVLHKMTVHPDEKAVLLLSNIHKNSVAYLNRYRESGIFDRVEILDELSVLEHQKYLERKKVPTGLILSACCHRMEKLLGELGIALKQEERYLCPDHFPFGWLVIRSKLPYHCFEEGSGVLSDREFALNNMKRNRTQYKLCFSLGCFGDNEFASEILADAAKQKPGYENPKMTDFSVDRILEAMEPEERNRVLRFFGGGEILHLQKNSSLLLTQHMANLGLMSLPEQHRLYTLFADYLFAPGSQLVIKPHPDDIAGTYRQVFGEAVTILPFAMPSELMKYNIEGRFQKAAAAYSTSVRSMSHISDETLCFDSRILQDWKYLPEYDCAVRFLQAAGIDSAVTDGDELLLHQLSRMSGTPVSFSHEEIESEPSSQAVVISDLTPPESETDPIDRAEQIAAFLTRTQARVVVFCQEQKACSFFTGKNQEVFQYLRPITLYMGNETHQIMIYTKEPSIMETAETFHCEKELPYTGVTIRMDGISASEAEKIRLLEGVLAATEKRLNSYIAERKKANS